jgi:hypothetical protein
MFLILVGLLIVCGVICVINFGLKSKSSLLKRSPSIFVLIGTDDWFYVFTRSGRNIEVRREKHKRLNVLLKTQGDNPINLNRNTG